MLQLKNYEQSIHETYSNIKLAIKRRDGKGALVQANTLPMTERDQLWKELLLWSVTETRLPDNDTLRAVKTLFDNYQLDPKKDFLERAISTIAYAARAI